MNCAIESLTDGLSDIFYQFCPVLRGITQSIITHFVLAPGSHHSVMVGPEFLESYRPGLVVGADKRYVGLAKRLVNPVDYQLITQHKSNQSPTTGVDKEFLSGFRKLIEMTNTQFSEPFNVQYSRAKSAWGLMSRVINKLTAHTLAIYLNSLAGRPLLAIKSIAF